MCKSKLKESIKQSLNIITKAIKQLPEDKKVIFTTRVNGVMNKYLKNDG